MDIKKARNQWIGGLNEVESCAQTSEFHGLILVCNINTFINRCVSMCMHTHTSITASTFFFFWHQRFNIKKREAKRGRFCTGN